MSTLYRLRFLDVSVIWWAVLALIGLAAGRGGDRPPKLSDAGRDRVMADYLLEE